MPCDTVLSPQQTAEQRRREVDRALAQLEARLQSGAVQVRIGPNGAVCFADWGEERRGVTDVCAYRTLTQRGSWELRQAVARAEAMSGRKVNAQAVAAGMHSHDWGETWSTHE